MNGGIHHESEGDHCGNLLNVTQQDVQSLHEIGNISSLDYQDKIKWNDLESVYSEVEKEFVCFYNNCYYEITRSALSCELPLPTVDTKRSGRPTYCWDKFFPSFFRFVTYLSSCTYFCPSVYC